MREKDNEHDINAVAVFIGNERLGYAERGVARRLAPIIDHPYTVHNSNPCRIQRGFEFRFLVVYLI